jgi:hypothetical protein
MSFVLRLDGAQVAISAAWHPTLFGRHTGTSFPRTVNQSYTWEHEGYTLAWEADPPPTQEQIDAAAAAAAQQTADDAAETAARGDATIRYLVTHTPQECYDKVQADVTSLATAKEVLGRLAMAVSVLAKDKLR